MKVKNKIKPTQTKSRKTKTSGKNKLKLKMTRPISQQNSKQSKTTENDESNISLIVNMDSSYDLPVPEILKNIESVKGSNRNESFNEQQLSDLVSPLSCKRKGFQINRIPVKTSDLHKTLKDRLYDTPDMNQKEETYSSVDGIEFYILNNDKVLLILTESMSLHFNGSLKVQVLMGNLEILGYSINPMNDIYTTYSTRGNSHLCLKAISPDKSISDLSTGKNVVEHYLKCKLQNKEKLKILATLSDKSVVALLQKNNDTIYSKIWPNFLFKHCSSYSVFSQNTEINKSVPRIFSTVEKVLNVFFELPSHDVTCKLYQEQPQWIRLENEIVYSKNITCQTGKTVLVGGKGVGKSTLLRYLVNKSLKKYDKVLVLDLDIGQSEFTVPGCVSAVLVDKPLLGPSFTHMMNPVRSVFIGDVNAVECLETYMKGFKQVLEFCTQQIMFQNIPWFVNTMGFCKALGFSITATIIQQIMPTDVVQIYSNDKARNFDKILSPQIVCDEKFGKYFQPFVGLNYKLHYIPSGAEVKNEKNICSKEWGIQPKTGRLLMLFSYLSTMLTPISHNLLELVPYVVNLSKLHLEVHGFQMTEKQAAVTMNGNLVALCCKEDKRQNLPACLGFGIVRGVDFENDNLFLITPLQLSQLQKVNCLVKGNISLPNSFILEPTGPVKGHVPYVSFTSTSHTSQEAKREYNPNKSTAGSFIKSY